VAFTTRQMNPDFTLVEDGPGARMTEMTNGMTIYTELYMLATARFSLCVAGAGD
jgi:hypothetical protein